MEDVEQIIDRRLADERRETNLELLRREHRLLSATLALVENWRKSPVYRRAALEGFIRCVFATMLRTGAGASIAGIGILGLFFAFQANRLLQDQTIRINIQSHLIEAQRRSSLILELGEIMNDLAGEKLDGERNVPRFSQNQEEYNATLRRLADTPEASDLLIKRNIQSQFTPSDALVGRIAALSLSLRPYYYVSYSGDQRKEPEKSRSSLQEFLDRLTRVTLMTQNEYYPQLIDKPVSPERGQLFLYMLSSRVNMLPIGNAGATFQGADLERSQIYGAFVPTVDLRGANFRHSAFSTVRFGTRNPSLGTLLDNADFTCATFLNSVFGISGIEGAKFAFVRFSHFNFVAGEGRGELVSFMPDILAKADLTDADFSDVRFTRDALPWVLDTQSEAPSGFMRSNWQILEDGQAANGSAIYRMVRSGGEDDYKRRQETTCAG